MEILFCTFSMVDAMGVVGRVAKGGKVNGLQLTIGLLGVLFYGGGGTGDFC